MNIHTGWPRLWWAAAQAERSYCLRQLEAVGEPGVPRAGPRPVWEWPERPLRDTKFGSYAIERPYWWVSPFLGPVFQAPEEFYLPVTAWYRYQLHHGGLLRIVGDRCRRDLLRGRRGHQRMVRWQWPPLPDQPVHGWRAHLVARALVATCMERRWRMGRDPWSRLQAVAKGKRAMHRDELEEIYTGIRAARAWKERKARPFTLVLGGRGVTLGRRSP